VREFFLPHRLLGCSDLYKAALFQDSKQAEIAFEKWLQSVDIQDITFFEHKPLSIAWTRHEHKFRDHKLAGVFTNIRRQALFRAHANSLVLRKLVKDMGDIPVIGLGEINSRWCLGLEQSGHLDFLELGVDSRDLDTACQIAKKNCFSMTSPIAKPIFRPVFVSNLRNTDCNLSLRFIGFNSAFRELKCVSQIENLLSLTHEDFIKLSQSTLPGLLRRQDQFLFDLAAMLEQPARFPLTRSMLSYNPAARCIIRNSVGV